MTSTPSPQDRLLADIFITALEGGIQYWAEVRTYRWMLPGSDRDAPVDESQDYFGYHAVVVDAEDGAAENLRIDRAVVARGYSLASSTDWRGRLSWSSGDKPPPVVTDDTEWDYDAGDADMIVQLGLFGDVVYG